ncbi:hypothetical protein GCM10025868_18220 [Angustibacter aerolatus]|uniref:Uncharacterized protein n=1 Tax=Angustibacter aerolatus TaxID=1162965 RepID=A0ABQ6JFK0_9ACTN|nr:hypothetical protein GCM10025868_18220 [Angustibacter aerolatus]
MAGAGGLVALLLGISNVNGQRLVIAVVGIIMVLYVLIGGMKGTTWVQIVKAVLLVIGAGVMTIWVLAKYGFNISDLLGSAADASGKGDKVLAPGLQYGKTDTSKARLRVALARPGARHRGPAARADALLHRALGQGGPAQRGLGDLGDRDLLPVHPGARVRRRRPGRAEGHQRRTGQGELGRTPAGVRASAAPCCWASSRPWPSPRSSPWSRGSRSPPAPRSPTTSTPT